MTLHHQKSYKYQEKLFRAICLGSALLPLLILSVLLWSIVEKAAPRLHWQFLTSYPSRHATQAGILPGLVGSFYLIVLTVVLALPLGIGAAIYLEEYGKHTRFGVLLEIIIRNLAGVPSIIYGLLGLSIFVRALHMDRSILAGACTLAILVLPIVIISSREALRTVSKHYHEASLALGATKWATIRYVILPMAAPGMLTGAILAISRAMGETAPLVVIGALTFVSFLPDSLFSPFTVLPMQIFNWVSRPQQEFVANAAGGIVMLLIVIVALNLIAVLLRNKLQKRTIA